MAIIQWALSHVVNPQVSPCNTRPAFTVVAHLVAQTDAGGLSYVVRVCDGDGVNGDVLDTTRISTFAGAAWHIAQHTFTLDCDAACQVKGAQGNSGEQTAEIYCNAEEMATILFAWEVDSWPSTAVTCRDSDEDERHSSTGSERSGSSDSGTSSGSRVKAVRLAWAGKPKHPVEGVKLRLPAPAPGYQIIPDEIDFKVLPLKVGGIGQRFKRPLQVQWKLAKRTAERITKYEGRFVRHDPKSHRWEVVENFDLAGGVLTFTTKIGGLFGVARGSRYRRYEGFSSRPSMRGARPRKQPSTSRGRR